MILHMKHVKWCYNHDTTHVECKLTQPHIYSAAPYHVYSGDSQIQTTHWPRSDYTTRILVHTDIVTWSREGLSRRCTVEISRHMISVTSYHCDDMTMISPLIHPTQSCPPTTVQSPGSLYPGIRMVWVRLPLISRTYTELDIISHSRKLEWWSVVRPHPYSSPWGRGISLPGVGTPCRYIIRLLSYPTSTVSPRTAILYGFLPLTSCGGCSLAVTLSWVTSTRQTVLLLWSLTYRVSVETTTRL